MVRKVVFVLFLFVVGACGGSSGNDGTTGSVDVQLQISEVVFGDHVTITNVGTAEVSIDGMWLCNRPDYSELSDTLAAGESVEIEASRLGGIGQPGGEVGLYSERAFTSSSAMVDYVAWGTGGGRTGVAVEAGLWLSQESAPNDGASISRSADASGAESWTSG